MAYKASGKTFTVNATKTGMQQYGDVAALESGGFATVWTDGKMIRAQLFGVDGAAVESEFTVNGAVDAAVQDGSTVAALEGGGFVVVWRTDTLGIFAQRFDAAGSAEGGPLLINESQGAGQSNPAVAALAGGGYAVSWEGKASPFAFATINVQTVDESGVKGLQQQVSGMPGRDSAIAKFGTGFVVTWQDDSGASAIKAQIYDGAGAPEGSAISVDARAFYPGQPTVAVLESGGFVIAWVDSDSQEGGAGIKAQVFDENGVGGAVVDVVAPQQRYLESPDVVGLPGGGFAVSWSIIEGGTSGLDVFARAFDSDGVADGSAFKLNTDDLTNAQFSPQVAAGTDGKLFALWVGQVLNQDHDIKGRLFGVGAATEPPVLSTDPALAILDRSVKEETPFSFALPAGAFSDPYGDPLSYKATLANGAALPSWLKFNAATLVFSGTPPRNYTGKEDVKVTASDGEAEVSDTFRLTVTNVNDAPTVSNPTPDLSIKEGGKWLIKLPKNPFADADGDNLKYAISLHGGRGAGALDIKQIVSYEAIMRGIIVVPEEPDFSGPVEVAVTASDGAKSVTDGFSLNVAPVNDAPVLSLSGLVGRTVGIGKKFTLKFKVKDADSDGVRILLSGTDKSDFMVRKLGGSGSGDSVDALYALQLKAKASPAKAGKDNAYTVRVTASDGDGGTDSFALKLKLKGRKAKEAELVSLEKSDVFTFSDELGSDAKVRSLDGFKHGVDLVELKGSVFGGLHKGALSASRFKALGEGSPLDRDDRIILSRDKDALLFDRDGSGTKHEAVKFADVPANASLDHTDFLVI